MLVTLLRAKLHRVRVTQCELNYEGSITIDRNLLIAAGMREWEKIHVWNLNNGSRHTTYILAGEPDSGMVCLNGPGARRAQPGDLIVLGTFGLFTPVEACVHKPRLVFVDEHNRVSKIDIGEH